MLGTSAVCVQEPFGSKERLEEAMSADATADADTCRRKLGSGPVDSTDSDGSNGSDDNAEQGTAVNVPLAAAPDHVAPEAPSARNPAAPTAGQVVPRVDVQNKHLKGLLMMDQYPWAIKLLDGRKVSPSEFERLAGSLRKNWKSSTFVLQPDGRIGMNVGQWMDMMGIHNPAKAKGAAPRAPAQPAQANGAKQTATAGSPAKRIRRAANPEKHLAELRALLKSHGKKLDEGWAVEYTEVKRDDRIDMDPYYYAPEGFVPDMAELPAGFAGKRYNSRKKVAQAHGIPAAAFGKPRSSARAPDAGAKSEARVAVVRKRAPMADDSDSKDDDDDDKDEDHEEAVDVEDLPPAKRTRTAAAAEAILSGKAAAPSGPLSPSTQTQNAGAQALLQLRAVDQAAPKSKPAPGSATADRAGSSRQQAAVRDLFARVQTFITIVEIDADSLKRKHIRRYMEQAKAGLKDLMEIWTGLQELEVD